jgi:polyhydroxyalkanoate synthase subunit PhaE
MSDVFKTWADGWEKGPLSFFKAMLPAQPASAAGATTDATSTLGEHFAELRDTWAASLEKWTQLAQQGGGGGPLTPEALRAIFVPSQWGGSGAAAVDAGLRQLLEGPKYAVLWDFDRQWLELQRLALQRDKDVAAYQAVVMKAWNHAFQRFSKSVISTKGEGAGTWREAADRWLAIANKTLIEAHRSDEFIEAQRRMLRSLSDYRLQERKLAEACCAACHVPTRTEMDEMQRAVTELKRELRTLRSAPSRPRAVPKAPVRAPGAKRKARSTVASAAR